MTEPETTLPSDPLLSYDSETDTNDLFKTINDDFFDDFLSFDTVTDLAWMQLENLAAGQSTDPLLFTIPELQLDVNDLEVEFEYDAREQLAFDSIPDIPVTAGDAEAAAAATAVSSADSNDEESKAQEWPKFEHSTSFPMTIDELEEDINNNFDRDLRVTEKSFYFLDRDPFTDDWLLELCDVKTDQLNTEKTNTENINVKQEDLKPKTIVPAKKKAGDKQKLKCELCSFKARSAAGLSEHAKMHSVSRVKCNNCKCITTKAYYLRRHNPYEHGEAFCCQICGFMTHSSSRIKTHMRKEH